MFIPVIVFQSSMADRANCRTELESAQFVEGVDFTLADNPIEAEVAVARGARQMFVTGLVNGVQEDVDNLVRRMAAENPAIVTAFFSLFKLSTNEDLYDMVIEKGSAPGPGSCDHLIATMRQFLLEG